MRPDRNKPDDGDLELGPYADLLRQGLPGPDAIAQNARRRRRQRRAVALLACCAAMIGLAALGPSYSQRTLTTAENVATWQLSDGSAITLNQHSQAQVSMHLLSRRVNLESGQGMFDVAHSPLRSFDVQTPYARVEDIGTVFDVRVLPDSIKVVVVQGLVRVHTDAAAPRDLHSDQAAEFGRHGDQPTRAIKAQYATAWRRGKMIFDATPLSAVAEELTRYGAPAIAFADNAASGIAISGQFDIARAPTLLDLLPTIAPVRISRREDGSALISSR